MIITGSRYQVQQNYQIFFWHFLLEISHNLGRISHFVTVMIESNDFYFNPELSLNLDYIFIFPLSTSTSNTLEMLQIRLINLLFLKILLFLCLLLTEKHNFLPSLPLPSSHKIFYLVLTFLGLLNAILMFLLKKKKTHNQIWYKKIRRQRWGASFWQRHF